MEGTAKNDPSTIGLRKEIPPFERESPVEEPLFINHCQVARYKSDAYIDVGLIPLDDILSPQGSQEVRFIVSRTVCRAQRGARRCAPRGSDEDFRPQNRRYEIVLGRDLTEAAARMEQ